ncbi:MAG: DEAD/DEAH box helicase [Solirubrobacterales bacterium]
MSSKSFADLGVSPPVVDALAKRGFHTTFAVQDLAIADVLAGRDVLVQSPTGSGKTLAFGVPIVDLVKAEARRPAALVLAPTRELAEQIVDDTQAIAHSRALKVASVYGGVGLAAQAKRARNAHIIVATPGRLEDLLQRREITLEHVGILVLDEADRMLDMGFKPPVDRIVKQIPGKRQTLFFSATLEGAAGQLAKAYTHDAVRHVHAPVVEKSARTQHRFVHVSHEAKVNALVSELGVADRTLVFVRTKRGADRLVKKLSQQKVQAIAMHGNKSQGQRRRALASFERGEVETMVATDVAARGIDVDDITHVINFDAPEDQDTYVHRTGRTGRAGRAGAAASFVLPDQHRDMRRIAAALGLEREFDAEGGRPHAAEESRDRPRREGGRRPSRNARTARSNGNGNTKSYGGHRKGQSRSSGRPGGRAKHR